MIEFSHTTIQNIVIHHIGCKSEGEETRYSKDELKLQSDELIVDVLKQYFFKPFKTEAYFNFDHEDGYEHNLLYQLVTHIFEEPESFYEKSLAIASHLYEESNHPKIRGGEFYMVAFENCVVDGEIVNALGIFKSENKDTFLKVYLHDQSYELGSQEGINIKKLDKGCLIFNTEKSLGYKICSVDNINKGTEAQFWQHQFLGLKPREDNYYFTNNYLKMCKGFVDDVLNKENDVPRPDQIDIMNRSMEFFNKHAAFEEDQFEKEVIRQPEVMQYFQDYKQEFAKENNLTINDSFDISKDAVKGEKKNFKSILKLDKNFHVYVHGKRHYIEKGFDSDRGLNFYKLFFEVEH